MADGYQVSSDDIEEALNVLRSLSDYHVSSTGPNGSVVKILTENRLPIMLKRSVELCAGGVLYNGG